MDPKMDQNGPNMDPNMDQHGTQNGPKMDPRMEPNGLQNGPKWDPKMDTMNPEMDPKRGPFGDPFYHIPLGYIPSFLKNTRCFVRSGALSQIPRDPPNGLEMDPKWDPKWTQN